MTYYLVSCSSCGSSNRIPAEKEGVSGLCGNCHAKLPPLYFTPRHLTGETFDPFVEGYGGPVLVEFWAPW